MVYVSREYPTTRVEPAGGTWSFPQDRKNRFCIYTHHRAKDGTVFYVGKGTGKRPYLKSNRTPEWAAIAREGYFVCILIDGISAPAALELERTAIEILDPGEIVNKCSFGSLGMTGRVHSEEHRATLSERMSGSGNPMFGKRPHNLGVPMSAEQRESLRGHRPSLSGDMNPAADLRQYRFVSDEGREFLGTRSQFRALSGLNARDTTKLVRAYRKRVKGWRLSDG